MASEDNTNEVDSLRGMDPDEKQRLIASGYDTFDRMALAEPGDSTEVCHPTFAAHG